MELSQLSRRLRWSLLLMSAAGLACTGDHLPGGIDPAGDLELRVIRLLPDRRALNQTGLVGGEESRASELSRDNVLLVRAYHPGQILETEERLTFNASQQRFEGRLSVKAEAGKSVALDVFQDSTQASLIEFGVTQGVSVEPDRTTTVEMTLAEVVVPVLTLPLEAPVNTPFVVQWSPATLASVPTQYSLEEDDNRGFSSPGEVYRGTATQTTLSRPSAVRLYYRVRAFNSFTSGVYSTGEFSIQVANPPEVVAPAAVTDLVVGSPTSDSITLNWTAPGDDGNTGTASAYDVRFATFVISETNWESATQASGEPNPHSAGSVENFVVVGLQPGTTYYFALKTRDEVPNWSALSNVPTPETTLSPPDTTPPSVVNDLAIKDPTAFSLTLTWTAPGDDGTFGTATEYDVRYSTSPIFESNWASRVQVTGEPAPGVAGSRETVTVTGLNGSTAYYFALKTRDEIEGQWSPVSNVPNGSTLSDDSISPASVTNLAVGSATRSSLTLVWTSPGDDDNTGTAAQYDIRYSASPILEANWAAATPVTGEPAPQAAGSGESFTVTGFPDNSTWYFALKTLDEASNTSPLSNVTSGRTLPPPDTVAPSAVADLAAGQPAVSNVTLSWTAPGDDGNTGTAAEYDIRYSTSSISEVNWASATPASGEPSPQAAGANETITVSGLAANTTWYFALKTRDEAFNESPLSNVSSARTLQTVDSTAPSAVVNLLASQPTVNTIQLTWTAPGDDGGTGTPAEYDIRYSTSSISEGNWASATPASGEPTPQAAGADETFTVAGLAANTTWYFALKTRDDASNESSLSNVTSSRTLQPPDTIAPSAVASLVTSQPASGSVKLTWSAPGDDENIGTAAEYDIRYSTSSISEGNWASATPASGEPSPQAAGSSESFTVTGLAANTTYYFALKTRDEASNESGLSNVPSARTLQPPDVTAPAAVTNLATSQPTVSTVRLNWTAPGDDGATGTAAEYDLRYSISPISLANWASATPVSGVPSPQAAGSSETFTVPGLAANTTYYFALKTRDEASNESGLSNVPSARTLQPPDVTAPAAVANLAASQPTVSAVRLNWTAPGDDGATGTAAEYDLRYSISPISLANWASATPVSEVPSPQAAGSSETFTVTGLAANTTYYFALKTRDESSNESLLSNVVSSTTLPPTDSTSPSTVTDLATSQPTASTIRLSWTAPGDDGLTGTATEYDIRYSTSSISQASWGTATPASGEPEPQAASSSETFTVSGLAANTTYYFALKTRDEASNESALSNVPDGRTLPPPDPDAPAAVTDLQTASPTVSSLQLTWTAPGDDGSTGTAALYDVRYSTGPISEGNWASCAVVSGEPTPRLAGSIESLAVTGLAANTLYYFALKSRDEVPNESALSNVASGRTAAPVNGMILVAAPVTFTMGSPIGEPGRFGDESQHSVTLTKAFQISDHEVTQGEWLNAMGWNESSSSGNLAKPVETITWFDAIDFCNRKSGAEFLAPAYTLTNKTVAGNHIVSATVTWNQSAAGYRLPTEAEWEAACRAGTVTAFANGIITNTECSPVDPVLDESGWYCGNAVGASHPVKSKIANGLGLYDMHGNVWEWCWDWWDGADYSTSAVSDPEGQPSGSKRAMRSGGWFGAARVCRSADRDNGSPGSTFGAVGLRLARNAP